MKLKTTPIMTTNERVKLTLAFKDYHKEIFKALNVHDPFFVIKQAYIPPELNSEHMHFFESELKKCSDIYVEIINGDYQPADQNRMLYRWAFNPNWGEEYHQKEIKNSNRIYIPCDELIPVGKQAKDLNSENIYEILEDASITDLTIKDIYAIFTGNPVSNKEWLNRLIQSHD